MSENSTTKSWLRFLFSLNNSMLRRRISVVVNCGVVHVITVFTGYGSMPFQYPKYAFSMADTCINLDFNCFQTHKHTRRMDRVFLKHAKSYVLVLTRVFISLNLPQKKDFVYGLMYMHFVVYRRRVLAYPQFKSSFKSDFIRSHTTSWNTIWGIHVRQNLLRKYDKGCL